MSSSNSRLLLAISICLVLSASFVHGSRFKLQSRIVGGQDAIRGQFPYSVSIRDYISKAHFCGGALISDQHILTAAHCLQKNRSKAHNLYVVVGALFRNDEETTIRVAKISIHQDFNNTSLKNDIAMIYAAIKIQFTDTVQPIALAMAGFRSGGSLPVLLTGFGRLSERRSKIPEKNYPRTLQWIQTVAVGSSQCARKYAQQADDEFNEWIQNENILDDDVICTLNGNNLGFCTGDSGSPLVSLLDDTLIGIVSWSIGCARGYPDVFTNVHSLLEWIEEKMDL